jgi:hypothetical protein
MGGNEMNQTYVYRKHLRVPLPYLILYEAITFLLVILMVYGLFLVEKTTIDGSLVMIISIILLGLFLIFTIEIVILYFLLFRRFKSISVTLTEDAIIYTNAKTQKVIPYATIEKLSFPSIKYTGGWVKIVHQGGTIRLTVVLEDIGDFISKLKEKLTEIDRDQVYDENKLFSFYKTAVFSDESWDRLYHNYKSYFVVNIISILISILILRFNNIAMNHKAYLYGSLFAPLAGFLLSELLIGMRIKKRVAREQLTLLSRDITFERKAYHILVPVFTCGYFIVLILLGLL